MDSLSELKNQLRKEIRQKKKLISAEEAKVKSEKVFAEVETMDEFKSATVVLAFWSLPDEISTHNFVNKWCSTKKIILPVVVGDDLELRLFTETNKMEQSAHFGIMEPKTGDIINPKEIDFAIIPGVAFDKKGNRLGRGKGYYDRLIPQLRRIIKVGVAYEFQLLESVPVFKYDLPVDIVVCN